MVMGNIEGMNRYGLRILKSIWVFRKVFGLNSVGKSIHLEFYGDPICPISNHSTCECEGVARGSE